MNWKIVLCNCFWIFGFNVKWYVIVERVIIEVLWLVNKKVMYCVMIFLFVSLLLFCSVDILWVVNMSCIRFCWLVLFFFCCWWIIFKVIFLKYFIFFFRCIINCRIVLMRGIWFIICRIKGNWKDCFVFVRSVLFGLVCILVWILKVVEMIIFSVSMLN